MLVQSFDPGEADPLAFVLHGAEAQHEAAALEASQALALLG